MIISELIQVPEFTESKKHTEIYRYLSRVVGNELSKLTKSCYKPSFVLYHADLKKMTGITDDVIKEFRSKIDKKYRNGFQIFNDKYTLLIVIYMLRCAKEKRWELVKVLYMLLAIKFQSSLVYRAFPKYCNEEVWNIALDRVSARHLYRTEGGISNAVVYLTNVEFKKNKKILSKPVMTDDELVQGIVMSLRHRLAQSMRSFTIVYYNIEKDYKKGGVIDDEEKEESGARLIAEKITMIMCIYNTIDKTALRKSIVDSGIRKDLGISIITHISDPEHKEDVKFIILLLNRLYPLVDNMCIETRRNKVVRKVLQGGKVRDYVVKDEIVKMLMTLENKHQLKTVPEKQLVLFFTNYLTLYIRHRIC